MRILILPLYTPANLKIHIEIFHVEINLIVFEENRKRKSLLFFKRWRNWKRDSLPSIRFYSRAHFSADYIRFVGTLDGVVFQISSRPDAFTTRGCSLPEKSLSTPLYRRTLSPKNRTLLRYCRDQRELEHGQISYFVSLSYVKRRAIILIWRTI